MSAWRAIMAIVGKDVAAELRSKEALSTLLIFALMIVVVFNFAFELRVENVRQIAPGVLWVAFTFAGILALNRSFVVEREEGCIEGLRLTPVDRGAIYLGKFLGNTLFLLVTEACILPIFAVLFDVSVLNPVLWLIMVLGTVGFVAVGTLFAAMAVNTRAREAMLPLLLFPIAVPVLIAATKATGQVLDGQPLTEAYSWLRLLLAFDIIFIVIAWLGFEYVLEE
jgi:heme exporter protein B